MQPFRRNSFVLISRLVRLGFKSLWMHRLRSLLTVLGIVFGVCSVIAMLAIGEGASYEAQEQIKSLGSQNIILRSIKPPEEQKVTESAQSSYTLDYGLKEVDAGRIRETIPGVRIVVPARIIREYVWNVRYRVDAEIVGTTPDFKRIRNQRMRDGRFFNSIEFLDKANVCVVGSTMAERLFPLEDPLGKDVRVGISYFRVIGVLEDAGGDSVTPGLSVASGVSGTVHSRMYLPLSTSRMHYGEILVRRRSGSSERERVELHELTVRVAEGKAVISVAELVRALLKMTHKKADYTMVVPLELLNRAEETKRIFNIVLGSIAAISLLVGGIGIMNIMLASVTERTREIGVRRALGAKRRDVTTQFLVETVILSGMGGLIGVVLGLVIPFLVSVFTEMVTIVTIWSPIIAFSISAAVGIVFGIYPATRAAKMDPVEALRHE